MANRIYGTTQIMAELGKEKPVAQLIAETEKDIADYKRDIEILQHALYAAEKELEDLYDIE